MGRWKSLKNKPRRYPCEAETEKRITENNEKENDNNCNTIAVR